MVKKMQSGWVARIAAMGGNQVRVAGLFTAVFFLAGLSTSARAQNTGAIFGNVVDQTGAAVSGATIVATDTAHGHHAHGQLEPAMASSRSRAFPSEST